MATNLNKLLRLNVNSICKTLVFRNLNTSVKNVVVPKLSPLFFNKNDWIYQQNHKIESPFLTNLNELPLRIDKLSIIDVPMKKTEIITPGTVESSIKKEAVKLIVIRRHKMRKHKLKKLRKKMKFEWAKLRQRREMRKEKEFQAGLISKIKEAEMFSAEKYVDEKIKKATETPIPRLWKGRRKPEFLIRQLMGLPPK